MFLTAVVGTQENCRNTQSVLVSFLRDCYILNVDYLLKLLK